MALQSHSAVKAGSALHLGAGLVILAGCLFATQDAIAKTLSATYSPFQIAWMRFAVHAALVSIWLNAQGHHQYLRTKKLRLHVARAFMLVMVTVTIYFAVSIMPLAQATVIQFLSPIIVTLLSVLLLGERIGWRRILAIVAGFSGVVIVLSPGLRDLSVALLLPLATAFSLAAFVLLSRRLNDPAEALPAFGLMPVLCCFMILPVMPLVWTPIAWSDVAIIVGMASCGTAAHICLQLGLRFAPASIMAPFLYSQVLWAAGLSIVVFADPLGINFIAGGLLIIGSGVAIWWFEGQTKRAKKLG